LSGFPYVVCKDYREFPLCCTLPYGREFLADTSGGAIPEKWSFDGVLRHERVFYHGRTIRFVDDEAIPVLLAQQSQCLAGLFRCYHGPPIVMILIRRAATPLQ